MSTNGSDLRDRPIGEIAGLLTRDLSLLVRQELELAKAEMREKGTALLPGIGMMRAALVAAICAAGAVTAFVVLLLALFLDEWLAAPEIKKPRMRDSGDASGASTPAG